MSDTPARSKPVPRKAAYHHGDLATALVDAGEAELREKGIEGFSLRGVAKRAGVSHAAPAHHFGDTNGLLTALAARGFERFLARQDDFKRAAAPDPRAQLSAAGVGYVNFALENPALFRLMFSSDRPEFETAVLDQAATQGFMTLVDGVSQITGTDPWADSAAMRQVSATWAIAHGVADLLVSGRLKIVGGMDPQTRNAEIAAMIDPVIPAAR